ncbi:MAG: hypothetical protein QM784_18125 [Polyangiaceae bacterium]
MRSRNFVLGWMTAAAVLSSLHWSAVGMGQSAADKATARQLATEAIQLYRQDRFRDALDKMERAEALFDAPVHLLYIARANAKLGKVVEAAEVYRRLIRIELSAQAPQTFRDAVSDGQKELADLEPRIPALRIEVVPAELKDVRIMIDDEPVSSAILGVNRPTNPGSHTVKVEAKDHLAKTQQVVLEMGAKEAVTIELSPGANTSSSPMAGGKPEGSDGAVSSGTADATGASGATASGGGGTSNRPRLKLLVGGLLETTLSAGRIDKTDGAGSADERRLAQRFGPSGGLEIYGGLSIPVGRYRLAPLLFIGAQAHSPGPLYKKSIGASYGMVEEKDKTYVLETSPVSAQIGIGVRFDTAPTAPWSLGGFGELGLVLRQIYTTSATLKDGGNSCKFTEEYLGSGLRLAGGALMPVSRAFILEGRLGWTAGVFDKASLSPGCGGLPDTPEADIRSGDQAVHSTFSLGVGGQFGFGL